MIRSWVDDGVGRVHIDDAEHRNVLSLEHSQEIAAAIAAFDLDEVGAIVLTAAEPVFCSGGVLDDLISPRAPLIDVYARVSTRCAPRRSSPSRSSPARPSVPA